MLKRFSVATSKQLLRLLALAEKNDRAEYLRLGLLYSKALQVPRDVACCSAHPMFAILGYELETAFRRQDDFRDWLDAIYRQSQRMSAFVNNRGKSQIVVDMNFFGADKNHVGQLVVCFGPSKPYIESAMLAEPAIS